MDVSQIASSLIASRQAQAQTIMAAKFVKMNAQQDQSVATLLNAAQENSKQMMASLQAGVGTQLDISA